MKYYICVMQTLRVERRTTIIVECEDEGEAFELVADGAVEVPPDALWDIDREDLEHEDCELLDDQSSAHDAYRKYEETDDDRLRTVL